MEETLDDIKSELTKRVAGRRVALVGVGNVEKGDDGFGIYLIRFLKAKLKNVALFECGTTPENYLSPIIKSKPDTLLIIDAANLGAEPGHIHIVEEKDIASLGLSTHDVSLKLFIAYIKNKIKNINIFLIGIQPKNTTLGDSMSEKLKGALLELEKMFLEVFYLPR